jgi:hypothetical protein
VSDEQVYRVTAAFVRRPRWGLGLVRLRREVVFLTTPGETRADAEVLRQRALMMGAVWVRLEEDEQTS